MSLRLCVERVRCQEGEPGWCDALLCPRQRVCVAPGVVSERCPHQRTHERSSGARGCQDENRVKCGGVVARTIHPPRRRHDVALSGRIILPRSLRATRR